MLSQETLDYIVEYMNEVEPRYAEILEVDKVSHRDKILAQVLTLAEEYWELNDEIKRSLGLSFSKKKRDNFKQENLENEAADVLLSTLMLIKILWIENMDEVIRRKIGKNNNRWY